MGSTIGKKLRDLRQYYNISQRRLAEGICTQPLISQIENGSSEPTAWLLYELSLKLGIDINYFFNEEEFPKQSYVAETKKTILNFIRKQEFAEAYKIIKREKRHPLFSSNNNTKFLIWYGGICSYYIDKDFEKAVNELTKALEYGTSSAHAETEIDIEIKISLAVLYSEEHLFEEALTIYDSVHNSLKKFIKKVNYRLLVRFHYNYSKMLQVHHNYTCSLNVCEEGIKHCRKNESTYLLGQLYYQKGVNHFLLSEKHLFYTYLNKALVLFEAIELSYHFNYCQSLLEKFEAGTLQKEEFFERH